MDPELQRKEDIYRDEYKLVYDAYKFFVSIRFIAAAFGMSIQSALFTIFNQIVKGSLALELALFFLAILFLCASFVIEWRTTELFRDQLARGIEIEIRLGMLGGFIHRLKKLSSQTGLKRLVTHRWGIRIVYLGLLILWFVLLAATIPQSSSLDITKGVVHV